MLAYEEYVSLGNNCEVAFQLRRVLGKELSGYFNWNITSFAALTNLLKNDFHGTLADEQVHPAPNGSLITDTTYGFSFHPQYPNSPSDVCNSRDLLASERDKFAHFAEKFRQLREKSVVFFYKTEEHDVFEKSLAVHQALLDFGLKPNSFALVVLQHRDKRQASWDHQSIRNEYLDRLAPYSDATDGHVSSWDRVFKKFPLRQELRFSGY